MFLMRLVGFQLLRCPPFLLQKQDALLMPYYCGFCEILLITLHWQLKTQKCVTAQATTQPYIIA